MNYFRIKPREIEPIKPCNLQASVTPALQQDTNMQAEQKRIPVSHLLPIVLKWKPNTQGRGRLQNPQLYYPVI